MAVNTAVGVFARIAGMVIGFAVTPVLLRSLGAAAFGVFAVIGSLVSYFGILDLGIGGGLVRYLTVHTERRDFLAVRQITTFGFLFYVVLGWALLPLAALLAWVVPPFLGLTGPLASTASVLVFVVFGLFIGSSISGVIGARLIAMHRMDIFMLASLGSNILYAGLVVFLAPRFPSLYFVFACSVAQMAFSTLVCWVFVARSGVGMFANPFRIKGALVRELFNFGAWTQINSISALVNMEADKLVIGRFIGVAEVAPYQVANRLALLNRALPLQLLGALLPDVTARIMRGLTRAELGRLYHDGSRTLMTSTLIISGFLCASAPTFITAWIGVKVPGADMLAVALVLSYAVNMMTGVGTTVVRAVGRPRYEAYYALLSAAANLGLTVVLVPFFGLYGVVGGTILGNIIGSLYFLVTFHRLTRLSFWKTVGSWLVPLCVGVATATFATRYGAHIIEGLGPHPRVIEFLLLIWEGVFYTVVAVLLLALLDYWRPQDVEIVRRVIGRFRKGGRPRRRRT